MTFIHYQLKGVTAQFQCEMVVLAGTDFYGLKCWNMALIQGAYSYFITHIRRSERGLETVRIYMTQVQYTFTLFLQSCIAPSALHHFLVLRDLGYLDIPTHHTDLLHYC